jgi:hypothetical protein
MFDIFSFRASICVQRELFCVLLHKDKLKLEVGRVASLSQLMLLLLAKAEEYEGSTLFLITY